MSAPESLADWRPWTISLVVSGGRKSTLELELHGIYGSRDSESWLSFAIPEGSGTEASFANSAYIRAKVPVEQANTFLERLRSVRVGIYLPGGMNMDGITYTLGFSSGQSRWTLSWWGKAQGEWSVLQPIADDLIELAQAKGWRFEQRLI